MRILVVAAEINPPWSEGRKIFVRDLLDQLTSAWEVSLLSAHIGEPRTWSCPVPATQIACRNKLSRLLALHSGLKRRLQQSELEPPDAILHFPFGTFSGIRGIANRLSIATIDAIAARAGIPCLTVLYSMTQGSLRQLSRKVSHLVAGSGRDWAGSALNMGINADRYPPVWPGHNDKRLLFMAGYSDNKRVLLQNILHERGLMQLIKAGEGLTRLGYTLTIAIPLLRYAERCKELAKLLAKEAPSLQTRFVSAAEPASLFASHSLYLFPYATNHTRFVPTSMLEAMACGIPVIAPRLTMLEPLIGSGDAHCLGYAPGDADALLGAVVHAAEHWPATVERARAAAEMVRRQWDIKASAAQLAQIVRQATGGIDKS